MRRTGGAALLRRTRIMRLGAEYEVTQMVVSSDVRRLLA